jgi:hypothetical protein
MPVQTQFISPRPISEKDIFI